MDEGLLPKIVMKKSHSTSRIILKQNSYFFLCVHLIFAFLREPLFSGQRVGKFHF